MECRDTTVGRRAQYPIPVKPLLAHIERWLKEEAERSGWQPSGNQRNGGMASPLARLAARTGMKESSCARALSRFRNETEHMSLDMAERFIAGTYGERLWNDPHLRNHRPEVPTSVEVGKEWRRADELEPRAAWFARVWAGWTEAERREVLGAMESLFEAISGDDDSTFARKRRARERFGLDPHPYAKLERPFGEKAMRAA